MERSTADTKKEVLSSHFVESSRPSLTTVRLRGRSASIEMSSSASKFHDTVSSARCDTRVEVQPPNSPLQFLPVAITVGVGYKPRSKKYISN